MKYRRFTKHNIRVSIIGLSTWQFGGERGKDYTQAEVDIVVDACRETGVNLIDTAECYGDGVSERLVGNSIAKDRDQWFVATKFGHRYIGMGLREQLWGISDVEKQLDKSLKNLRTDYIDLYQFHSSDNDAFEDIKLWEMLHKKKEEGKIRFIGVALTSRAMLRDYQAPRAAEKGADSLEVIYSKTNRGAEEITLPSCLESGLGVLARVPLSMGFVEDHTSDEATLLPADDEIPEDYKEAPTTAKYLSWCINHDAISCIIPGARDSAQLRLNASASDLADPSHPLSVN